MRSTGPYNKFASLWRLAILGIHATATATMAGSCSLASFSSSVCLGDRGIGESHHLLGLEGLAH